MIYSILCGLAVAGASAVFWAFVWLCYDGIKEAPSQGRLGGVKLLRRTHSLKDIDPRPAFGTVEVTHYLETERCTGRCCKHFTLGDSLTAKDLEYMRKRTDLNGREDEGRKIVDMLIPLGLPTPDMIEADRQWPDAERFTCKHFDKANGNCNDYANRPVLCSGYPNYERDYSECRYRDCTRVVVPVAARLYW